MVMEMWRQRLKTVKRVLIKIGSNILTGVNGVREDIIAQLCKDIANVKNRGLDVIIVSSGAISSGLKKMNLGRRPNELSQLQALAAIGQGILMRIYEKEFDKWGIRIGQLLITKEDLGSRRRYLNIANTLFTLLHWKVIPIINENDTVAADEIKFGDNDNLAALITILSECQLLINLTNMDGLFERDPKEFKDARLIPLVEKIDKTVLSYASKDLSLFGTGGMQSKLQAARKASLAGVPTVIANGNLEGVITKVLDGEEIGTLILPMAGRLSKKKHWLAFGSYPRGMVIVDEGAEQALLRNGKSLLPSGILALEGVFQKGDPVSIKNTKGEIIGIGIVNYSSSELEKVLGRSTMEIQSILGFRGEDEIIHRNNMVITAKLR